MNSELPLVSIIVPIYNVEKYLKKCIDSIVQQSFENLEIILVNDGSPDNCLDICLEYEQKDPRIRVINKVNGGLSDARNKGIDVAKGDYLAFVDSDDYIHTDMIERMINLAISKQADIVICGHSKVYETHTTHVRDNGEIHMYNNREALKKILEDQDINSFAWDKIYKKELLTDLRYPRDRIFEDTAFTYKVFAKAQKIIQVNEPYYYYLMRGNSLSNTRNIKRNYHNFLAFYERFEFANNNYKEVMVTCAGKALHQGMNLANILALDTCKEKEELLKDIQAKIFDVLKSIEIGSLNDSKLKVKLYCYRINPKLYRIGYRFFNLLKS